MRLNENSKVMVKRHRALLRGFFETSKAAIERWGRSALEVHVTHNTSKNGVDMWQVAELGEACSFEHVGTHKFDASPFREHGYKHRKGGSRRAAESGVSTAASRSTLR